MLNASKKIIKSMVRFFVAHGAEISWEREGRTLIFLKSESKWQGNQFYKEELTKPKKNIMGPLGHQQPPVHSTLWNFSTFISSKFLEFFQLNFDTLIKDSVEIYLLPCLNFKHLRMRNFRWILNTYYLPIAWFGFKWKLTLMIPLDKWKL